ncbi:MAG: lysylphosphatidylglycerol synthase transmembrane domain-containing protein [Candidatus Promineifilaceae bacterium]
MRRWQFWLGILISGVFVVLALRGLRLDQVWHNIRHANYIWLVPSVLVYFAAVVVRTWRWGFMLRPLKKVSVPRLFPVVVIGYMGNNIFPFRAGELLRSYVLRQREAIAISSSLATVVVERVFDGLVMLVFVFVALPLTPIPGDDTGRISTMVTLASVAFFGAMIVFFILAAFPDYFMRTAEWFGDRLLPQRIAEPMLGFLNHFIEGLASLRSFRNVIMIFFTSVLIWLLETVKYWFVMHAFDFQVSFFALMLMNGVVNLATTLPSAPGYVGTFDEPGIEILKLYGVNENTAAAYTLILHAALWLPITLLGFYYMLRDGMSWSELSRAMEGTEEEVVA